MKQVWEILSERRSLDDSLKAEIENAFGSRGKKAIAAIEAGKVKKYLDFFVVEGRTASYIVDEEFCTCGDFMYRGRTCWHLLAVKIVSITGTFAKIDEWYIETMKNERSEQ